METRPESGQGAAGTRRVLLVSPTVALRERFYDLLTSHGHSVKTIDSGQRALASLRHERPDVVIADSLITDGPGWSIADRIHSFDPSLPIVLVSTVAREALDPRTLGDVQAVVPPDVTRMMLLQTLDRLKMDPPPAEGLRLSGTVLLVDDEPELLRTLQQFLESRGCSVLTASSGEEALGRLATCHPSFVLLDIKMPGMDGLVTLKKIKVRFPDVPVIMATAVDDAELITQAFTFGAYDYVIKPFNLRALHGILLHLTSLLSS